MSLIVRQLEAGDFSASPRLEGVPLQRTLTQPRALKPDRTPDLSIFGLLLTDARNVMEFSVNQIVEFEP